MRGRLMRNYSIVMLVLVVVALGIVVVGSHQTAREPQINRYYPLPDRTYNPQQTAAHGSGQ